MYYDIRGGEAVVPESMNKELGIAKGFLSSRFGDEMTVNDAGQLLVNVKGRSFVAIKSFYNGAVNVILFECNGIWLMLAQNHSRNLLVHFCKQDVSFGGPESGKAIKAIQSFKREGRGKNLLSLNKSRFGGFLVSYPRPYHFFYDSAPSFVCLQARHPEATCVAIKESLWLPPSFFSRSVFLYESKEMMNKESAEGGAVFCSPIIKAPTGERLELFDGQVKDYLEGEEVGGEVASFLGKKDRSSFLLWFGVCSEKRSLLNEREILEVSVNRLIGMGLNLHVVFDGITSPYNGGGEIFQSEKKVSSYKKILEEMGVGEIFDLTGRTSIEKLHVARKADFFISSFLTDSIYVSRFFGIDGVAHGSENSKLEQHVHRNADFLFGKPVEKSLNWSTESYSVDVERFEELLVSKVKGKLK